jgi:hypothetical protein
MGIKHPVMQYHIPEKRIPHDEGKKNMIPATNKICIQKMWRCT